MRKLILLIVLCAGLALPSFAGSFVYGPEADDVHKCAKLRRDITALAYWDWPYPATKDDLFLCYELAEVWYNDKDCSLSKAKRLCRTMYPAIKRERSVFKGSEDKKARSASELVNPNK